MSKLFIKARLDLINSLHQQYCMDIQFIGNATMKSLLSHQLIKNSPLFITSGDVFTLICRCFHSLGYYVCISRR